MWPWAKNRDFRDALHELSHWIDLGELLANVPSNGQALSDGVSHGLLHYPPKRLYACEIRVIAAVEIAASELGLDLECDLLAGEMEEEIAGAFYDALETTVEDVTVANQRAQKVRRVQTRGRRLARFVRWRHAQETGQ